MSFLTLRAAAVGVGTVSFGVVAWFWPVWASVIGFYAATVCACVAVYTLLTIEADRHFCGQIRSLLVGRDFRGKRSFGRVLELQHISNLNEVVADLTPRLRLVWSLHNSRTNNAPLCMEHVGTLTLLDYVCSDSVRTIQPGDFSSVPQDLWPAAIKRLLSCDRQEARLRATTLDNISSQQLLRLCRSDSDASVRLAAAGRLGRKLAPNEANYLRRSRYEDTRAYSIASGLERDLVLQCLMKDRGSSVREAAWRVLSPNLREEEAFRLTVCPDAWVRLRAVQSGRVDPSRLREVRAKDPDQKVREEAWTRSRKEITRSEAKTLSSSTFVDVRREALNSGLLNVSVVECMALGDPDPQIRASARSLIGNVSAPAANDAITSPFQDVRSWAVGSGKLNLETLIALMEVEAEDTTRAGIWECLFRDASEQTAEMILASNAFKYRAAVVSSISLPRGRLLDLSSSDWQAEVRHSALNQMGRLTDYEVRQVFDSIHADVRLRAIESGRLDSQDLVDTCTFDPDASVRRAAWNALRERNLTGSDVVVLTRSPFTETRINVVQAGYPIPLDLWAELKSDLSATIRRTSWQHHDDNPSHRTSGLNSSPVRVRPFGRPHGNLLTMIQAEQSTRALFGGREPSARNGLSWEQQAELLYPKTTKSRPALTRQLKNLARTFGDIRLRTYIAFAAQLPRPGAFLDSLTGPSVSPGHLCLYLDAASRLVALNIPWKSFWTICEAIDTRKLPPKALDAALRALESVLGADRTASQMSFAERLFSLNSENMNVALECMQRVSAAGKNATELASAMPWNKPPLSPKLAAAILDWAAEMTLLGIKPDAAVGYLRSLTRRLTANRFLVMLDVMLALAKEGIVPGAWLAKSTILASKNASSDEQFREKLSAAILGRDALKPRI